MPAPDDPAATIAQPARPSQGLLVFVGLAGLALTAFTTHKLILMARLRGERGDVPVRELVIGGEVRRFAGGNAEYALADPARPDADEWTIQLTPAQAAKHRPNTTIAVRCARRECYLPDSTYISDGNVAFDLGLLVLEIAGTTACLFVLIRRRRAWRAALRGAHLPSVRVHR